MLFPAQPREEKATETIVHFKWKEYHGSGIVSASKLPQRTVHVKAAEQKTK